MLHPVTPSSLSLPVKAKNVSEPEDRVYFTKILLLGSTTTSTESGTLNHFWPVPPTGFSSVVSRGPGLSELPGAGSCNDTSKVASFGQDWKLSITHLTL